ncbi:hypothetical protein HS088_TW15G00774 [Tripterygium wilfordii]|uniref:Expansin-like EG45 domain-containing protein n=1 Tax=Tripterygium wilfordii TaxID=458696 RepID=A0A7J7CMH5_TRIWF|nr:hypothetical protein HS088_TW15G00774 [Tripterygium wilfordii]
MAFLFEKSSGSKSFVLLALLALFTMSFFSLASAFSAQQFKPPYNFEGCPTAIALNGYMYAKLSDRSTLWENGAACGKYYKATCIARVDRGQGPCIEGDHSVIVRIAGICRDCPADILMTQQSFAKVAKREIFHNLKFHLEE